MNIVQRFHPIAWALWRANGATHLVTGWRWCVRLDHWIYARR